LHRILLLGTTGQLGWELERTLQPLGDVIALDYPDVDMADPDSLRTTLRTIRPGLIINATAYSAVDKAESEPDLARAVNTYGPGILAEEARKQNAALVHFSTDFVFNGGKGQPYDETDAPDPINIYGRSKLDGEHAIHSVDGAHIILRTAWVYSLRCENFVSRVLKWARQAEIMHIVDDQVSNPTWARMLAEVTAILLARGGDDINPWLAERKGVYHLAGDGQASRFDWAQEIIKLDPDKKEHQFKQLLPALTSEFHTPARRPLYSALNNRKFKDTFNLQLPDWKWALEAAMRK
jgi:dTDP-4-dehydrorhamnose reductase